MTNTGKIDRLPSTIREQINQRLLNGEPADSILKWLHSLTEVWTLIRQQFNNQIITPQNLSEWRTGGFAEWKLRRELTPGAQVPAPDQSADGLLKTSTRKVADHLAEVLAGLYARLIHHWDGEATPEFTARLRALSRLCRDICALRKSEHQAAQLKLEEAKLALRQKRSEDETEDGFLKWLDQPGIRERILNHYHNTPSPDPDPSLPDSESSPIKPNQASSGVGTARPHIESSATPSSPTPPDHPIRPQSDPSQEAPDISPSPNPTKSNQINPAEPKRRTHRARIRAHGELRPLRTPE